MQTNRIPIPGQRLSWLRLPAYHVADQGPRPPFGQSLPASIFRLGIPFSLGDAPKHRADPIQTNGWTTGRVLSGGESHPRFGRTPVPDHQEQSAKLEEPVRLGYRELALLGSGLL